MNEIAGIYFKTAKPPETMFSDKAFDWFRGQYSGFSSEISEENLKIIVASKSHLQHKPRFWQQHITAFGGYLLNQPDNGELNNYDPALFHGKFLFVHINRKTGITKLYNDMLGHFPVYYYENHDCFYFSSNLNFLLKLDIDKTLSLQHIADYFFWGSTLPGTTFFEKINLLPPASKLILRRNRSVKFSSYKIQTNRYKFKNAGEAAEELNYVLKEVVGAYYSYYDQLSFTLTGGLDTRFMASFVQPGWNAEFVTMTDKNVADKENNDIIIAKRLSEVLEIPHRIVDNEFYPRPKEFNATYFSKNKIPLGYNPVVTGIFASEIFKLQAQAIIHPFMLQFSALGLPERYSFFYNSYPMPCSRTDNETEIPFLSLLSNDFNSKLFIERIMSNKKIIQKKFNKAPVPVISNIVTRSYFSNFYGGHTAGNFSHYDLFSNLLMPFVDQKVLEVAAFIPFSMLGTHGDSVYSYIFGEKNKLLGKIPTNTALSPVISNVFLKFEDGKNPIYFIQKSEFEKIDFECLKNTFGASVFDEKKLRDMSNQHLWIKTCLYDFLVWFEYVFPITGMSEIH